VSDVRRQLIIATTIGMLGGCAVGPDFQAPAAPTTGRYTAQALPASSAASNAGPEQRLVEGRDIPAEWWALFRSDGIDSLMRQAMAANPDLQAADAALRAARENVLAQQGAYFPSVSADYNATRQGVADPIASPLSSGAATYTLHTGQLTVGFVPDVFGGNRRQVESLQAQADAQRYQLEAARLTLASNVVVAAVQHASTRAQIEATRELIDLASRQLTLLQRQQTAGQIGSADVAAQEAALAQAQVTLPPLEKQLAQLGNQLAVLTGSLPSDTVLPDFRLEQLQLPEELPLSLPSKLVEQRPDIRAAEAQLHAASAQVGVAVANRLPSFNLSAGVGSSALKFSQLFGAGTGFWSLGADVTQTVFDAGTLMHRQRAVQAGHDQAAALYRSTVLTAFQNVADTLNAIQSDARALDAAVVAERAAQRSLAIARRQHAAGSAGVLVELNAEQTLRQAMLGRIQSQANRLADSAALFQALGGGWWNRSEGAAP
jgi:NodT family efflux transporter outer membrane factor (OMF) lipoprotein